MMAFQFDRSTLVAAINSFHESVHKSCLYKGTSSLRILCSSPIWCTWFHNNTAQCHQIRNTPIFICDELSYPIIKLSFMKVSILAEGIAWPHVTICRGSYSVQWILLGHDMGSGRNTLELPSPFIWFVVSPIFQRVFEYTLGLLKLDVKEIPLRLNHCSWSVSVTIHSCNYNEEDGVILKLIVSSPENILISVISSDNIMCKAAQCDVEYDHRTVCVASKNSQWYKDMQSTRPHLFNKTELDHHALVNRIPGYLQCIVDLTIEATMGQLPRVVGSEVGSICDHNTQASGSDLHKLGYNVGGWRWNFGEESSNGIRGKQQRKKGHECSKGMEMDTINGRANCSNNMLDVKESINCDVKSQPNKFIQCCKCKNLFRLKFLECPKCNRKFRFGLHGNGLKYLVGHVYEQHGRLSSYCLSTIQRNYAYIINAAHDKNCRFTKLKVHMLGK